MRFMSRMLTVVALMITLMVLGCGQAAKEPAKAAPMSVADQAKAAGFEIVDLAEAKMIVGNGVWDKARGTLVDARPERKFDEGHIPTSKLIPDTKFDEFFPAFAKEVGTGDYIVTFCGGLKCEKSLIVAEKLREKGYKNVKIFLAGQPAWNKSGSYNEVSLAGAQKLHAKGATFIDARPERKFKGGTIPGSVVVPDTKFDAFKGNLPADKAAVAVPFCGGYKCEKSHIVAEKMLEMGYTNILVYAGGEPEWKAAGLPIAPGGEAPVAKKEVAASTAGYPVEEPGIIKTDFFIASILDPATRPANVTIVDVRNDNEVAAGKIPGSLHVSSKETANGCDAFLAKMPKEGNVIFHCASGGRAGETYFFLADDCKPADISRYYFLDAGVNCDSQPCKIGN
ncbi:MAG: rhodanese-like domain-containing protein [Deferribacterales bacterium]|jgi:rhodanese-related sulfurtransferase